MKNLLFICGPNGIGKTTLLRTIMGQISALDGLIEYGDYLYPTYFEQEYKVKSDLTAMEEVWQDFQRYSQKEIRQMLARVGLKQEHVMRKLSALSGGEQSKVRLCKLMLTPSNWLLLDEPTNHLDTNAKESLKESLKSYKGSILLICHEKQFYENWVTDVWDMAKFRK
jgi:ATPase subunit of ABC transporter with duplicated ATPase domains